MKKILNVPLQRRYISNTSKEAKYRSLHKALDQDSLIRLHKAHDKESIRSRLKEN